MPWPLKDGVVLQIEVAMHQTLTQRLLAPLVDIRRHEIRSALLMFVYAFLLMTSYNIVQPLTRSKLISDLGAVNIPYVVFVSSLIVGLLMVGYVRLVSHLPRRLAVPIVQTVMAAVMVGFWALFRAGGDWVSVPFYLWGFMFAILVTSQFWTLANGLYDPRQAKRLFGFIGGGIALGGATGAWTTALMVEIVGTNSLLLWSAAILLVSVGVVTMILRSETETINVVDVGASEKGVGLRRALELLRGSRQAKLVALVIGFGSIGAALLDQQLNMATEIFKGRAQVDAMGAFLAQVRGWVSLVGFFLQVWVTPRIHRYLGIAFALMLLPTGLAATAGIMLIAGALWAPAVASVLDRSVRYTVDKTTREVLFLPLPAELRQEVKPFVDVTGDRLSRGVIALVILVLVQPWGLGLRWYQLSFVSLGLAAVWFALAVRAKREYLASFRRSIERRDLAPAEVRLEVADLSTVETLVEELASPNEARVLYAIDLLESLDKRNLVTPLLLNHGSPAVRARALRALGRMPPRIAARCLPAIQRLMADPSADVRAGAVGALANIRDMDVIDLVRGHLADRDPRIATTAAVVLARSTSPNDVAAAESVLVRLASEAAPGTRREVAAAVREIPDPRFRQLLIPLLYDTCGEVAGEALRSVRELGPCDFLFVPTLISLLRRRDLKRNARDVLVSYGEPVLDVLNYFLRDDTENIWVRRHIPGTIARIPSQRSIDILTDALHDADGFLRHEALSALETIDRDHHRKLRIRRDEIEALTLEEAARYFKHRVLYDDVFVRGGFPGDSLLAHALQEKITRTTDRVYWLLGLLYPWKDVAAARWAIERGDPRARASALEYLDNLLGGGLRQRLMPMLEKAPVHEKDRRANATSRPWDADEALAALVNDDDEIVAAAAIDLVNAHRASERRPRVLLGNPLPPVQLVARLRRIPLFASLSVDDLFRIVDAGRQIRFEPGRALLQEGAVPIEVHVLLDGAVSIQRADRPRGRIETPAALGIEPVLQASAMRETVRTLEPTACLVFAADDMRALVSESSALVQGFVRTLAHGLLPAPDWLVVRGGPSAAAAVASFVSKGLRPIGKVLVLEQLPVFRSVSAAEMLHLASIARPVVLRQGALVDEVEGAIVTVLEGRVSLEAGEERPVIAETGDAIGVHETLAGVPLERRAVVLHEGRGLRIERDDLFDLLGRRPALLQELFAGLLVMPRYEPAAV
ncbi:MAG TPA: Npt1/Npt2 family nucleotide transporter [Vicinamibacterales bacterium]|nr:Npt1/Npt2 family nucleotide transporter [Vicinamibacterales bacterium]